MPSLIERITSFFLPPLCLHCRAEGAWLCAAAQAEIKNIPLLIDPLQIEGVDRVICRGDYDLPILGQIIQRIKYDGWTAPARDIFSLLFEPVLHQLGNDTANACLSPIPLHWRRRMQRGFNQSELMAKSIATSTRPISRLLRRHRFTTAQAKLDGQRRITNVHGAFQFLPKREIPSEVILVDDVITTGSTIKECAAVLRAAGVEKITAIGLAKG